MNSVTHSTAIKVSLIVFSGIAIVGLYSFLVPYTKYNASSFVRDIRQNVILKSKTLELKNAEHLYLAGSCDGNLYLGSEETPLNLLEILGTLADCKEIKISADQITESGYIQIDSPFFYVGDRTGSNLVRGNLTDWKARRTRFRVPPFIQLVCIDSTKLVIHTTIGKSAGQTENVLGQIQMDTARIFLNRELLDEQREGVYSTDGMLRYNAELRRVIFIYFYRNEVISADTELGEVFRFTTIDTTRIAQLTPVAIGANSFSLTTPPLIINKNARCYKQYLLIHSEVRAQNERVGDFDKSMVIDVYDLRKGTYCFSFYVLKEANREIDNFYIVKDQMILLAGNKLISYDLRAEDFTESNPVP